MYRTGPTPGVLTLAEHYEHLLENLEDINYRMFDLHFRFYPGLRKQFDLNRRKHPRVAEAVFRFNANVADANNLMQLLNETGCETLSTFHLRQLRMSFLQAIEDVMFDEATEALIADCAMVFDELLATLRASRREESPQDGPRTQ